MENLNSVLYEGRRVYWHQDNHQEGTIMFADGGSVSILWDENNGENSPYSFYDASEIGDTILLVTPVLQQTDIERVFSGALTNHHRAFKTWLKLTDSLNQVMAGTRHPDEAFNQIEIRDCLPRYTVLATTWNIEDIREKMPFYKSDEELFDELLEMVSGFENVAVSAGNDVISDHFTDDIDQEVLILKAWAVKDEKSGYGYISTEEEEAREEYPDELIVEGYTISGGASIRDYVDDTFRDFYESKEELLEAINQVEGMAAHVNDISID